MFRPLNNESMVQSARWLAAVNSSSGLLVPPNAVVIPTTADQTGTHTIAQATANGQIPAWLNSGFSIQPGGTGIITKDWPAWALYNPADGTPAPGQIWGPGAASWSLRKNQPGFLVIGQPDTTNNIVEVQSSVGTNACPQKGVAPLTAQIIEISSGGFPGQVVPFAGSNSVTLTPGYIYLITATLWCQVSGQSFNNEPGYMVVEGWLEANGVVCSPIVCMASNTIIAGTSGQFNTVGAGSGTIVTWIDLTNCTQPVNIVMAVCHNGTAAAGILTGATINIPEGGEVFPQGFISWIQVGEVPCGGNNAPCSFDFGFDNSGVTGTGPISGSGTGTGTGTGTGLSGTGSATGSGSGSGSGGSGTGTGSGCAGYNGAIAEACPATCYAASAEASLIVGTSGNSDCNICTEGISFDVTWNGTQYVGSFVGCFGLVALFSYNPATGNWSLTNGSGTTYAAGNSTCSGIGQIVCFSSVVNTICGSNITGINISFNLHVT